MQLIGDSLGPQGHQKVAVIDGRHQLAHQQERHGYGAFTSTLLASVYQNHDKIAEAAERFAKQYGVRFLYRDFRPNFRAGNQRARELGFYMQKYCGCVFSEADRYQKQIDRDREKYAESPYNNISISQPGEGAV